MREPVPTNDPEAQKRRSTRIVQAVPLSVSGVDALGRPFQERTSTLIINCHGCRYQSKHYVLKNMWVTLEVPHPESGHPARTVRGRVMWIQRPRTVRELFQVGLELEVCGNFWGIAFPPQDWFPFPEGLAAVPSPAVSTTPSTPPAKTPWPPPSAAAPAEGNVRTLPLVPLVEEAPPIEGLAPQIAQLIEEAKQNLQAVLRQSAAEAVSLEARPLIASLELQLRGIAEKSLEAAAGPAAEKAFQQVKQLQVDAFLRDFNRGIAESAKRAVQQLASQLEELEKKRSAAFEQRLQEQIQESLERLQKQAADLRPQISPQSPGVDRQAAQAQIPGVQELEQRVRAQVEQASARLSEIESASRHLREQAASAFRSAQSDWKAQVEADLSAAADRWHQRIESSIESAKQQLAEGLAHAAHPAAEDVEKDLILRLGGIGQAFMEAAKDTESRLHGLHASLDQENERAQESLRKFQSIENQSAKLQGIARAAEQALEQRAGALLEAQSQELARRAEGAITAWAERLQPVMSGVQELEQRFQAQIEQARISLAEIESSSRHLQEQSATAFASAESGWRARVEADLAGATNHWNQGIESSIESAKQQLAERLARQAQSAGKQLEKDLALRIDEISRAFVDAANDSEARLNTSRASLDQGNERAQESVRKLQSIENQIESQSAKLQGIARAAEQALEQRAGALLEAQSEEMARRAQGAITAWAERLLPALEASGQQTVTRLAAQLQDELNVGLKNATEVLARLETRVASAEEVLRNPEQSLAKASEQAIQSACEQVKDRISALTRDFQESGRAASEKWISEIDAKATDTTHHTFESLFKTAEWYGKKAHTQMQAAIDKGMENALATLKEKAGEMSGIFGTELDHYSRSYVEHTQGQVEEAARESLERMRKQAEEMAADSAGSIVQQAREDTEGALADFRARADSLSAQIKTQFEAQAASAGTESEAVSQQLSAEFRAALKLQVQDELGGARKELLAQIVSAREELHLESEAQQQKLAEGVAGMNDEALEDYRRRLETASNSWLLTTVAKLSQQSDQHVQRLTKAAEERLRAACTEVFSGVGDALRRGLLDVDSPPPPPRKTGE